MRLLLDRAFNDESIQFFSSPVLIDELTHTLGYAKFTKRIMRSRSSVTNLATHYLAPVRPVSPTNTLRIVSADDDHAVAAALAANADLIVTGAGICSSWAAIQASSSSHLPRH